MTSCPSVRVVLDLGDGGATFVTVISVGPALTPAAFGEAVRAAGASVLDSMADSFSAQADEVAGGRVVRDGA